MIYGFGLAAITVAWLLPGHYFPWVSFQQDLLSAVGAWLVALGAIMATRGSPLRGSSIALLAVVLALVPLIQWALGVLPFSSDAILAAAYLVGFAMSVIAGTLLARSDGFVGALFAAIGIAAAVSVGMCLIQWLQLGPIGFIEQLGATDRIAANFTQPNQLASLLGMAIAAVVWAYESRRIGGLVAALSITYFGLGLVMTQARVSWAFALVFVLMWALARKRVPLRTPPIAVILTVATFVAAVLLWSSFNVKLDTGAFALPVAERAQVGYRGLHWQVLWDALVRSPWFGYGWQQVSVAQQATVLDHPPTFESLIASHNQVLDLLLWNGLPIGLLVTAFVVWWSVKRLREFKDVDSWALLTALGLLCAHSMVEFPLQYAYFLLPAGLMIGAVEARRTDPVSTQLSVGRWVYGTATIVMAALLGVILHEYLQVEESVRRVRLRDAGYVQPGFAPVVPDVELLDGPRDYIWLLLTTPSLGMSEVDFDKMRAVVSRNNSPPAMARYAAASALNGRGVEAERALRIMCHTQLERQCDQWRKTWLLWSRSEPRLAAIKYPETPRR